jgi:hypothetical protein
LLSLTDSQVNLSVTGIRPQVLSLLFLGRTCQINYLVDSLGGFSAD